MLELNKVYNMDCVEGMKLLDDECIDLTVTSPPYDNLRTYNGFTWDFESVAKELYRVTKQGGVVVWMVADATIKGSETGTSFRQALYFMECGFNLHDTMIWQKDAIAYPDANRYQQCFEYMFIFSKGAPKTINLISDRQNKSFGRKVTGTERSPNGVTRKASCYGNPIKKYGVRWNVWIINNTKNNGKRLHPAPFPERLASDHIISWSNDGDTILDCFMGSGTTAKMAMLNNRNYIGFELSSEYCEIAKQRIEVR